MLFVELGKAEVSTVKKFFCKDSPRFYFMKWRENKQIYFNHFVVDVMHSDMGEYMNFLKKYKLIAKSEF